MDGHELFIDKYFHSTLIDIIWTLNPFGRIFNELEWFFRLDVCVLLAVPGADRAVGRRTRGFEGKRKA